jgi:hypothetical protein
MSPRLNGVESTYAMREFWQRVQELMRLLYVEPPSS